MVEVVSNLLKLTDYPFSYTIAGLLLLIHGHGTVFTKIETFGPLLLIMGVLGTTLSITDPLGNLMRYCFQKFTYPRREIKTTVTPFGTPVNKVVSVSRSPIKEIDPPVTTKQVSHPYFTFAYESEYLHRKASKSVWVSYEIDKFVSMLYFSLILGTVVYFLIISDPSQIENKSSLTTIICKAYVQSANITETPFEKQMTQCISGTGIWITLLVLAYVGVLIVIFYTLKRLFNYVRIVAGYFFGTSVVDLLRNEAGYNDLMERVESNCKEQLDYLNKKDWTMAGIYWDKIMEDIGMFTEYPEESKSRTKLSRI